jgi:hypothetical protein
MNETFSKNDNDDFCKGFKIGYFVACENFKNYLSHLKKRAINSESEEWIGVHFAIVWLERALSNMDISTTK